MVDAYSRTVRCENNEDTDIDINSIELKLSDNLELVEVLEGSQINQFPGLSDGIFMWVGQGYSVKAGGEINLKVSLRALEEGTGGIMFRVSAFDSYVEAEGIEVNIAGD